MRRLLTIAAVAVLAACSSSHTSAAVAEPDMPAFTSWYHHAEDARLALAPSSPRHTDADGLASAHTVCDLIDRAGHDRAAKLDVLDRLDTPTAVAFLDAATRWVCPANADALAGLEASAR